MTDQIETTSDFPVPKFRKGGKVWFAWTDTTTASHPCPDCQGTKTWECTSPAGHTMEMQCPRCDRDVYNDALNLRYTKHTFGVRELTIGSIQIDTNCAHREHPVSYMCIETGVGSGSVYSENRLYATKAEAEAEHEQLAANRQVEADSTPEAMTRLEYSRRPYFSALEIGARKNAEAAARERLKAEIEEGVRLGNFTPGPWVASVSEDDGGVCRWDVSAQDLSSDYASWNIASGYGGLSSGFASREHAPGNALLIAAAPDLLGAAKTLIAGFDADGNCDEAYEALHAAIAKATGVPA